MGGVCVCGLISTILLYCPLSKRRTLLQSVILIFFDGLCAAFVATATTRRRVERSYVNRFNHDIYSLKSHYRDQNGFVVVRSRDPPPQNQTNKHIPQSPLPQPHPNHLCWMGSNWVSKWASECVSEWVALCGRRAKAKMVRCHLKSHSYLYVVTICCFVIFTILLLSSSYSLHNNNDHNNQ